MMRAPRDGRPWHRLARRRDAGGVRYFLSGRPVHCGAGLELRLPAGAVAPVRFELDAERRAVLYLRLGGPWEELDGQRRCDCDAADFDDDRCRRCGRLSGSLVFCGPEVVLTAARWDRDPVEAGEFRWAG